MPKFTIFDKIYHCFSLTLGLSLTRNDQTLLVVLDTEFLVLDD